MGPLYVCCTLKSVLSGCLESMFWVDVVDENEVQFRADLLIVRRQIWRWMMTVWMTDCLRRWSSFSRERSNRWNMDSYPDPTRNNIFFIPFCPALLVIPIRFLIWLTYANLCRRISIVQIWLICRCPRNRVNWSLERRSGGKGMADMVRHLWVRFGVLHGPCSMGAFNWH